MWENIGRTKNIYVLQIYFYLYIQYIGRSISAGKLNKSDIYIMMIVSSLPTMSMKNYVR